jgi:hypothetical protein
MILFVFNSLLQNEIDNKAVLIYLNYSMIWEKEHFANALTAKSAAKLLRRCFSSKTNSKHRYHYGNNPVRDYLIQKNKTGFTMQN